MIKIDIWSDFVCPFCYIGKRELDLAIVKLGMVDEVDINYHAYQLHPEAPTKPGNSYNEGVMRKYGASRAELEERQKPMIARAENLGLAMRFDQLDSQNTYDAHRLAKYAKFYNKEIEFFDRCYTEIFAYNSFIADPDVLMDIAAEVGLDPEQAKMVIEDKNKFKDLVEADRAKAMSIGISGVPFFVFNDKYAINGAQDANAFISALEQARGDGGIIDLSNDANICGPEGC